MSSGRRETERKVGRPVLGHQRQEQRYLKVQQTTSLFRPGGLLRSLLPLRVDTQQAAHGAGQADKAIVELGPSESRARDGDVAQVADELDAHSVGLPLYLLLLDDTLAILLRDVLRALAKLVERVKRRDDAEGDAREPGTVALAEEALRGGELADRCGIQLEGAGQYAMPSSYEGRAGDTHHSGIVQQHVPRISELAPDGGIPQHRVHRLCVAGHGSSLEVLDKLAHAHQLPRQAELLLGRLEGRDRRLGMVGAVEVPGQEARKVLESPQDLVAADRRGRIFEEVGHGRVLESVGDHGGDGSELMRQ